MGLDYQLISVGKPIVSSESLITRNGAGIEKPADLKGKRIAVPIGSTSHFWLMGALKTFGLTEKDVTIVGMSPPEIAAAWSQNAIDAAFVWNPVQAKLRENGKPLTTAGEVAKAGFPTVNGWVVNRSDGSLVALFESKYRLERLAADNPDYQLARMVAGI